MDMSERDVEYNVRIKALEGELKAAKRAILEERVERLQAEVGQCQGMMLLAQVRLPQLATELAQARAALTEAAKDGATSH